MKKILVFLSIGLLLLISNIGFAENQPARDLVASLGQIPGLADSPDKGAFVDIVKAINEVYPGKIKIEVYPIQRSIANVIDGKADFHIPIISGPGIPETNLPFRFVSETLGSVSFVLYSNINKKVTKKEITDALAKGGKFPYQIEGANPLPFVTPTLNNEETVRKLIAGRIDAVVMPQEDIDSIIKQLKAKTIHRTLWGNLDDSIIIPKGHQGDVLDKILSDCIRKLKASGRLQELHNKIHLPYNDWQPADMGW